MLVSRDDHVLAGAAKHQFDVAPLLPALHRPRPGLRSRAVAARTAQKVDAVAARLPLLANLSSLTEELPRRAVTYQLQLLPLSLRLMAFPPAMLTVSTSENIQLMQVCRQKWERLWLNSFPIVPLCDTLKRSKCFTCACQKGVCQGKA